jgi:superfamily II DNA or RNA helicase
LTPWAVWLELHRAVELSAPPRGRYSAFHACRVVPEAYQFAPLARLLSDPGRSLLIADDVGLGKTVEAGICLSELMARGVGRRILLVVPPGLIPQWLDEMWEKFGLRFTPIENSASLDRAQTSVSEGIQPWAYFDRVITSTEYLKRGEVHAAALSHPWDAIVVDEAHYLAESGTPANPYTTARGRLGPRLRQATRSLILLTATPHNGYRHSFRSLIELIEPTDAALQGKTEDIQRRVARSMIRRLKHQIIKTSDTGTVPAFPPRLPVQRIEVKALSDGEREIFSLVSSYCRKTAEAAAGSEESDLVSFAMQIIKKRMLSSRAALAQTIKNRLEAVSAREPDEPPTRAEVREFQADVPLGEATTERIASRIVRTGLSREAKRREAEKKQLRTIAKMLGQVTAYPDPKLTTLARDLETAVLTVPGEKAIVFTEYRDSLNALRELLAANPAFENTYVELTGGLSPRQRKARIARFHEPTCRVLLATDAASEGLNLQKHCHRLYHLELPWNPNRLEQRNGRIDRHGQTERPLIKYLFHAESPEDYILDRLIQRIGQMHDDRVSTPDILGIVESSRLESTLCGVDSMENARAASASLIRVFDEREREFAADVAPLFVGVPEVDGNLPFATAVSADPMLEDDGDFEQLMMSALYDGLSAGLLPGTWRITVPHQLQGPEVEPRYVCATFRRSVAIQYPASDVEFVHRLHPLFRALSTHALRELTFPLIADGGSSARVAVRRHPLASTPLATFTYLEQRTDIPGQMIAVAIDLNGQRLPTSTVDALLATDSGPPGDVPWALCESTFAGCLAAMQEEAAIAALDHLREATAAERTRRAAVARVMREEAALYRVDRRVEIDREEREEAAGPRDQLVLFRDTSTPWKARRAAIETHYTRRLSEIDRFAAVPEPQPPQPLGVLLVFPPV